VRNKLAQNNKRANRKKSEQRDLGFFGTITASVSHDLSNVVSILYHLSGLLEDLIQQSEDGMPIPQERLVSIKDRLGRQSERANQLAEQLNRFAHGVEQRWIEFEVNSVIQNLVAVSKRFADLKGLTLQAEYSKTNQNMVGDPFSLQQVAFEGLQRAYSLAWSKERVHVQVSACKENQRTMILISRPVHPVSQASDLRTLEEIACSVPAKIELREEDGQEQLLIHLET
jgi:C4-dicarboxylate-specific signal transduction histidine kinase